MSKKRKGNGRKKPTNQKGKQGVEPMSKKHWTEYVSLIFSGIRAVEGWDKFVERIHDLLNIFKN